MVKRVGRSPMGSGGSSVEFDEKRIDAIFAGLNQCQLPGAAVGVAIGGRRGKRSLRIPSMTDFDGLTPDIDKPSGINNLCVRRAGRALSGYPSFRLEYPSTEQVVCSPEVRP